MSTSLLSKPDQVRAKNPLDPLPKPRRLVTTLDVEWDPVLDATSYVVEVAEESWLYPFAWTSYEVSGSTTSFSIPDLKHYSPYCVRVTARTASETLVGDLTRNLLTLTCEDDCMVLRHQHQQEKAMKQTMDQELTLAKDKIQELERQVQEQVQELTLAKDKIQELEHQVQAIKRRSSSHTDARQRIRSAQILNKALQAAALTGRMDLVLYFVGKSARGGNDLDWDGGMEAALEGNHGDLVHYFIVKGAKDWSRGLMVAIEEGHLGWVDFFLDRATKTNHDMDWSGAMHCAAKQGAHDLLLQLAHACAGSDKDIDWDNALCGAAKGGHQQMVEYLAEHFEPGFKDLCDMGWNDAMCSAALGGHKDLVEYFAEKASKDGQFTEWSQAMCHAAEGGHKDLVEYCIDKGLKAGCVMDWKAALCDAIEDRHVHLFRLFIEKGGQIWSETSSTVAPTIGCVWNDAVCTAAHHGHKEIADYFIDQCAKTDYTIDWSEAMSWAALGGHLDLVEYFVEMGSKAGCVMDWNLGMCFASLHGDMDVVGYFIDKGANGWKNALLHAQSENHKDLISFFDSIDRESIKPEDLHLDSIDRESIKPEGLHKN